MDATITQELTVEEVETGNLSAAELSSLIDLIQAQIEYHRDEIVRLRPILHRLQERIPDSYTNLMDQVKQFLITWN
jgi:iron-sulfur cluster repair protein YtfE (RIC family)